VAAGRRKAPARKTPQRKEASIVDPILKAIPAAITDPPVKDLVKGRSQPVTGGPGSGRTTLDEAKRRGPVGFLQLLGPGLITGASDDDPSGIGTYSQVGSQFGFGMLWTALFTFPLMAAVQELCGRIALHTGVGLGVSLRRKFPVWIVAPAILGMMFANTINLGADLGAIAVGGTLLSGGRIPTLWLIVPVAALVLSLQLFTTYTVIFKAFKYLTLALFAYVITVFVVHPDILRVLQATLVPHFEFSGDFITAFVAVLGTTISPYLFFWQASSEVDEMKAAGQKTEKSRRGTTLKELRAARFDILIGMFFSQLVMYCIILTTGATLHANGQTQVQTAQDAAQALAPLAGPFAFVLFAVGLIGTGMLAIPILSGSAAYAFKEFVGFRGGLAVKPQYRPTFYGVIVVATIVGVVMNFLHLDPIKALFITAVINGLLAPPLLILIVLLGSDRKVMRERASGPLSRTLTWAATAVMSAAALTLVYFDVFQR
jgi:NRAMP (natural resistance-associated macrophage protein)-like metal ion transporter